LSGGHQQCVKYRAEISLQSSPNCKESAEYSVTAAWEKCLKDIAPFDHTPHT